jgi:lipopolysaccharide biosynthesis regulator YciM
MTTKNQYIQQARAANPKPQYRTVNGVEIELSDDEYEASLEAWAEMRLEQDATEASAAELLATKKAAYAKLGLTNDEIEAVLGA